MRWELWRGDTLDRELVERFVDRPSAERRLAELDVDPGRQRFWIVDREARRRED